MASARVYGFARSIIFGPVSKVVLCPVSMSDGAVRGKSLLLFIIGLNRLLIMSFLLIVVLELYGTQSQKDLAIPRLLSTDPAFNLTAGQFMTERPGGSDVSQTETTATPVDASKVDSGDKVRHLRPGMKLLKPC